MSFPEELRYTPNPSYDKWGRPPVRAIQYTYAGDLGKPWDGMDTRDGYASVAVWDDGRVEAECGTGDGMTADGLACSAEFSWHYDPATRTLSWEQHFMTWEPGKLDRSKSSEYNDQFYHSLTREEWLAATGVDGGRLDAWVDDALGFGIRGWLAQNAGRTRFSLGDLGDLRLGGGQQGAPGGLPRLTGRRGGAVTSRRRDLLTLATMRAPFPYIAHTGTASTFSVRR